MIWDDPLPTLDGPPLSPERKAAIKRMMDKLSAWCEANPHLVPRLPHYRHTCLNPTTCTLEHDTYPHHP